MIRIVGDRITQGFGVVLLFTLALVDTAFHGTSKPIDRMQKESK